MALESTIKTQLQSYLQMLREPIMLIASQDNSAGSIEMKELLEEVTSMSDKISLRFDDNARKPSFAVKRAGEHKTEMGVRFAGIPMGHEFTSLVLALLHAGAHPMKLEAEKIAQIAAIEGAFNL